MLDSLRIIRSHRGNVLIYTMLLAFFATVAAYLLFAKSETLFTNLETSRRAAKLDKNLTSQADLAIKYAVSLNKDGGGFTDTLECPNDFTLTNTSSGTIVETGTSTGAFVAGMLRCNGNTSGSGWDFSIEYSGSGSNFGQVGYLGVTHTLTPAGARLVGPVFTGSGGFSYQVGFTLPTLYSGIDINGDSDDRRPTSTGAIGYPLGITDNDALGREVLYGYIRRDTGLNSIFWNTKSLGSFIAANPYNSGSLVTVPWLVSSGALHLTIDGPYTLRIEEYDRTKYLANRELSFITGSTIYSWSGGVGYIQSSLALSGEYGNTGAIASARKFDLANRDYAVFLSYSGSSYNEGADFLRYQIKASSSSGVNIALSPLNDENPAAYRYLANTIIFDGAGERLTKMQEVVRPSNLTTTPSIPGPTFSIGRTPAMATIGDSYTISWSSTNVASINWVCSWTAYNDTGSIAPTSGSIIGNYNGSIWVGSSTCTWTATGVDGSTLVESESFTVSAVTPPSTCTNWAIDHPSCSTCGSGMVMISGNCTSDLYTQSTSPPWPINCAVWFNGAAAWPNPVGSCDWQLLGGRARTIEQWWGYAATYYDFWAGSWYGCAYGTISQVCSHTTGVCSSSFNPASVGFGTWDFFTNIAGSQSPCALPM